MQLGFVEPYRAGKISAFLRRHPNLGFAMRVSFFYIAFVLCTMQLLMAHTGSSQSLDEIYVKVELQNEDFRSLFKKIQEQTHLRFAYDPEVIEGFENVTITLPEANRSIKATLDLAFAGTPLIYRKVNNSVVIYRKGTEPRELPESGTLLYNVSGRVTNTTGEAMPGVNVVMKGTTTGTSTNSEGRYDLNVEDDATLVFSFIGYKTYETLISNRTVIDIVLEEDVSTLKEVIVNAGYYNVQEKLSTGNIVKVSSEEIQKQPVNNPILALAGRVPGLEIQQQSGLPGAGVNIQIRGQNSVLNGNDPLYVIDGVPYASRNLPGLSMIFGNSNSSPGNPFSYINPADIESIEVLKDADATAIYGSRGANGVILITTKKGKAGETKVSVTAQTGIGQVGNKMDLLNTRQYLDMRYEALKNDGVAIDPSVDYDLALWDTTRYTDWQEELIGGTAHYNDIQASVSGGTDNTQIFVGVGYHKETTVFPGDFNYQRASAHFNINHLSSNKKFRITMSGTYSADNNQLSAYDLTEQAMKLPPNAPAMYNPDGSINWASDANGFSSWPSAYNGNPAALMLMPLNTKTNNLIANSILSYQLATSLDLKCSFGYTTTQTNEFQAFPFAAYDPATWSSRQRSSQFARNDRHSWIIEPQLSYNFKISKGEVQATAGATFQENRANGLTINASGFNSDNALRDLSAATTIDVVPTTDTEYRYSAAFARFNYNWQDRYILNLTWRRDGTSRFGPDSRFHNFGAVGLGWIFTNEKFVSIPVLSYGKLRVSYGTTGSDQIGDYRYMDLYQTWDVGVPYMGTTGIYASQIYTPDLAWEETRKLEAALDLGFLQDKLTVSISAYQNRSDNQVLSAPLPSTTGFTTITNNVPALVENRGLEIRINSVNLTRGGFQWSTSFNLSTNHNKLLSVPAELTYYQTRVGHALNASFAYKFIGVDPITGLYQVADANGEPTTTPNSATDMTSVNNFGTGYYGGLGNTITWNNFQLDIHFQFVQDRAGYEYLYSYMPGFAGYNQPVTVLERWRKPGDVNSIQRFGQKYDLLKTYENARNSDQQIGDASYIRLKNISLSWQLPAAWKQRLHLQNARVFAQGQNLFTITKYRGLDPENRNSFGLPPLRVITVGLEFTL